MAIRGDGWPVVTHSHNLQTTLCTAAKPHPNHMNWLTSASQGTKHVDFHIIGACG
jgi:hypothetical protein